MIRKDDFRVILDAASAFHDVITVGEHIVDLNSITPERLATALERSKAALQEEEASKS
jgi:hypothetical protein